MDLCFLRYTYPFSLLEIYKLSSFFSNLYFDYENIPFGTQ